MKLLLDTHVVVWAIATSSRLSVKAADAIRDRANEVLVSAVSAYEIEFKRERDLLLQQLPSDLSPAVLAMGFEWTPTMPDQAFLAGQLPKTHRDPWDRVLVGQSLLLGATLVTADPRLSELGAKTLW